jgi:hypothetical protein
MKMMAHLKGDGGRNLMLKKMWRKEAVEKEKI